MDNVMYIKDGTKTGIYLVLSLGLILAFYFLLRAKIAKKNMVKMREVGEKFDALVKEQSLKKDEELEEKINKGELSKDQEEKLRKDKERKEEEEKIISEIMRGR